MGMSRKGFRRGMAKLITRGYSKDKAYGSMLRMAKWKTVRRPRGKLWFGKHNLDTY